jgi:hypothetical protein
VEYQAKGNLFHSKDLGGKLVGGHLGVYLEVRPEEVELNRTVLLIKARTGKIL